MALIDKLNWNGIRALVVPVDPAAYPKEAAMPSYPGPILAVHVALRTAQVGGLVGLVYGPVKYMRKDKAAGRPLLSYSIPRMCLRGTIYGGTLGIALVVARSAFLQADEVVDRGFRVYHNKQQALSDVFVAGGGFAGGFFGLAALRSSGSGALFNAARGSALGMVAGIGTYAAARYLIAPTHDLWKP